MGIGAAAYFETEKSAAFWANAGIVPNASAATSSRAHQP